MKAQRNIKAGYGCNYACTAVARACAMMCQLEQNVYDCGSF